METFVPKRQSMLVPESFAPRRQSLLPSETVTARRSSLLPSETVTARRPSLLTTDLFSSRRESLLKMDNYSSRRQTMRVRKIDLCVSRYVSIGSSYAAWALLLSRYEDAADVEFGVVIPESAAQKNLDSYQSVVAVQVTCDPNGNVGSFLKNIGRRISSLKAVKEDGDKPKASPTASMACGFRSNLSVIKVIKDSARHGSPAHLEQEDEKTPTVDVHCTIGRGTTILSISFIEGTVAEEHLRNVLAHWDNLIEQLGEVPAYTELGDLNHVSSRDREQIAKWNQELPAPIEECVHETFSRTARQQPRAPAICSFDANLSYGEVDDLSSSLAGYLVNKGIALEQVVPMCFDKSGWVPVIMMAINKAGGAYAHLSTSAPLDRMRAVVEQCGSKFVITDDRNAVTMKKMNREVLIINEKFIRSLPTFVIANLPTVSSTNIAYVIFTSGSTGTPKAVVIEHGSVATCSFYMGPKMNIGAGSRVLNFSAYTFDICMGDILISLMKGACVCTLSDDERLDDLEGAAARMQPTYAFFTPSVARTVEPTKIPTLRTLVVGGEAPTRETLTRWADHVDLRVITGPAETTIYCSITEPSKTYGCPQSVGKAVGCRMWVVDPADHTKLVPVGCAGELVVEGRLVSRGYLNDEEKTKKSFIEERPDWIPEGNYSSPTRLYKTGDLVKWMPDGTQHFVGRKDLQVKINGQRVELEEIDFQIRARLPDLEGVVSYVGSAESQQQQRHAVVAFLVFPKGSSSIRKENSSLILSPKGTSDLMDARDSLSTSLPPYMIPTLFIPVTELPLSANGKTDRLKLKQTLENLNTAQISNYSLSEETSSAPLRPNELSLRALWADVLGIDESSISSNSHFIRLGGNSMKAMQMVTRASSTGNALTTRDVMGNPLLSCLADLWDRTNISLSKRLSVPVETNILPFSLLDSEFSVPELISLSSDTCHLETDSIEDIYPCTPMQEGLLSLSLKIPGTYIMRQSYQLEANINLKAYISAWNSVYKSLDILHTRFVSYQGQFCQVVVKDELEWHFGDELDDFWAQTKESTIIGEPLFRAAIISSKGNAPTFAFTAHHALYDGFMLPAVFEQVQCVYEKRPLEVLYPFKNFIAYLKDASREAATEYWTSNLDGSAAASWPIKSTTESKTGMFEASVDLPSAFLCDFTLPTVVQAAYTILLSAYSSSQDVSFGMTLSGRDMPVPGIMSLAGPTLATVPFRITWDLNQSINALLHQIQNQTLEAEEHSHIGLREIRRCGESADAACDFRTLLIIQPLPETPKHAMSFDVLNTSSEVVGTYGLTMECRVSDRGLVVIAEYHEEVMTEKQAERFTSQLTQLVQQLLTDPTARVGDLDLVSKKDLTQLTIWNSLTNGLRNQCIDELIGAEMIAHPNSEAICAWDGSFTYGELDVLSLRVASIMRKLGGISDEFVPIIADKSAWVLISLLGILRAGQAFLLLDPSTPQARLLDIVQQTKAKTILVSPALCNAWSGVVWAGVVQNVLPCSSEIQNSPVPETFEANRDPSRIAYSVFTSGSTGRPKGVLIEHAAFVSSALSRVKDIHRNSDSRVYQYSSYAFDTCVEDMLTTLLVGGAICIPSESERKSNLAESITKYRANVADLTPSVLNLLSPHDVNTLKTVILGGEKMTKAHVDTWASHATLINTYGPAELSIVSTVARPSTIGSEADNIGFMTCGHAWVVDNCDSHRLLPIGAIGELLISGPILARGYLDNPEQTDKAFVTGLRFAPPETRFYKTGDLVRRNEDSTFSIIGRKDNQLKIHGQRVELGEIEQNIQNLPNVNLAAVQYLKLQHYPQSLVAFIALKQHSEGDEADIIAQMTDAVLNQFEAIERILKIELPQYMVPTFFVPLHRMPVTISGKLDSRALKALAEDLSPEELLASRLVATSSSRTTVALQTAEETIMQKLWSHILKTSTEHIHAASNFFRLGGDSISVIHLTESARRKGYSLNASHVLQYPVLRDMAVWLRSSDMAEQLWCQDPVPFALLANNDNSSHHESSNNTSIFDSDSNEDSASDISIHEDVVKYMLTMPTPMKEEQIEDIYPCTALQEGFMAVTSLQNMAYVVQQVYKLGPGIDLTRFRNAWARVAQAHAILRTRIVYKDGQGSLQVVSSSFDQWCESESLDTYLAKDKAMGMDYGMPLTRFGIINPPRYQQRYFVYTGHHATFDGYTMSTIFEEAAIAYQNESQDLPSHPPFSRFVGYLHNLDSSKSYSFWNEQLSGTPSTTFLTPPPNYQQSMRKELTVNYKIPLGDKEKLNEALAGSTLAILIRAAWAVVLAEYSESTDVLFGCVQSGRSAPVEGIAELIGPTISTVPVRVSFERTQKVHAFLKSVQQQAIDMIPFEHDGLQNIEKLSPGASGFHNILVVHTEDKEEELEFEIMKPYNYEGSSDKIADGKGYHENSLVVDAFIKNNEIEFLAAFDSTLITDSRMKSVLYSFGHVVQQIFATTEASTLSDIDCCSPQDRDQILKWNAAYPPYREGLMHAKVGEMMALRPRAAAIDAWDGSMTFGELDAATDKLASYLARTGLDPASDIHIPLCFEKSVFTSVCMLAILKLGAAYVPIDPSHPTLRIRDMVSQVKAKVFLTSPTQYPRFAAEITDAMIIVVDEKLFRELDGLPLESLPIKPILPQSTAMIVFTSGSTGQPKGIEIMHGSFVTFATGLGPFVDIGHDTRVLQFCAYAFDASNADVFMTWINGGCLCIPSDYERLNDLTGAINRLRATWINITPSATALIESPAAVPTVKTIKLVGEPSRQDIVDTWSPFVKVFNGYGPAEVTVECATLELTPGIAPVNMGDGGDLCLLWLVDVNNPNRLAAIGTIGELYLEGPLLAKGYLYNEEKTKESFIDGVPWLGDAGKDRRVYRTKDLGRYNADGSIDYFGRIGGNAKVRGQRLDLGDVEANVKNCATPRTEVCAAVIEKAISGAQLVAFVTVECSDAERQNMILPITEEFRSHFQRINKEVSKLVPPHMVPSLYIPLGKMPITKSGKSGRGDLEAWFNNATDSELHSYRLTNAAKRLPATIDEIKMQKLWSQCLGIDEALIGAQENWFEIGGNSLLSVRLVSKARAVNLTLTVRDIFLNPILSDLAAVAGTSTETVSTSIKPFTLVDTGVDSIDDFLQNLISVTNASDIQDVYPCTSLQEGLVSLSMQQDGAYIASHAYELPVTTDFKKFQKAWQSAVDNFDILRTEIVSTENHGMMQIVHKKKNITWNHLQTVEQLKAADKDLPSFDGKELAKFCVMRDEKQFLFLLQMHHALFDEHSLNLLLEHVEDIYHDRSPSRNEPYNTFVSYTLRSKSDKHSQFWSKELAGCDSQQFLQDRPVHDEIHREVFNYKTTIKRTSGLSVTTASLVQAAWAILLASYSQSEEILHLLTVSGRDAPLQCVREIGGPTITTFPRKTIVKQDDSVEAFLTNYQRQTANLAEYSNVGLQNISRLPGLRNICSRLKNLLIIQSGSLPSDDSLMKDYTIEDGMRYHTYPMVMGCAVTELETSKFELEFQADFDTNIISPWEVERLVRQFAHVTSQLNDIPAKINDIEICSPDDRAQIDIWHSKMVSQGHRAHEISWIVDVNGEKLAPLGAVGELCTSGPRAVGVPGPMFDVSKCLRTGKLMKYRPDGTLELLGLKDRQVRGEGGALIDLNKIESIIEESLQRPIIVAAEIAQFLDIDTTSLAVFLIVDNVEEELELAEVIMQFQQNLRQRLPSYMVPSVYVPLIDIPYKAGVPDHDALLELAADMHASKFESREWERRASRAPSTDMESKLQQLFASVLNISASDISADDNWILLNGDSISAIRLVTVAREQNVTLTVSNILRCSSLAHLAATAIDTSSDDPSTALNPEESRKARIADFLLNGSLATSICKSLRVTTDAIEDIAPATDFQVEMFTSGMMKPRGWQNYMIYGLDGIPSMEDVHNALKEFVIHNPIMRTVFVIRNSKVIQVVLNSVKIEGQEIHALDLQESSVAWMKEDISRPSSLDKPVLHFALFKTMDGARLMMRLSHTQYDGVCMPSLCADMQAAFDGISMSFRPSFSGFASQIAEADDTSALTFWRETLEDAQMTSIVNHNKPGFKYPLTSTLTRQIPLPNMASHGYTTTTLLKAAWSLVLARWSGNIDVTFGHLVSGRGGTFDNAEVVGPCLNLIPVRTQIWSNRKQDLLSSTHNQHMEGLSFEATGFSKIVRECTNWRKWERFSSVLQYQNLEEVEDELAWVDNGIGGKGFDLMSPAPDSADIWMQCTPCEGKTEIRLDMDYSEQIFSENHMEAVMQEFCLCIDLLSDEVDGEFTLAQMDVRGIGLPRIPVHIDDFTDMGDDSNGGVQVTEEQLRIVRNAWRVVGLDLDDDTPYYDSTGDLVPAVAMVPIFKKAFKVDVCLEELIEHPTIQSMAVYLQLKVEENKRAAAAQQVARYPRPQKKHRDPRPFSVLF